jgi:uncharacterized protein YegP (UPF0339 family)
VALTEPVWEITRDKQGQYRFALKSRNGEKVFQSESYPKRISAMDTISAIESILAGNQDLPIKFVGSAGKVSPGERRSG